MRSLHRKALLLAVVAFAAYNANLRLISSSDALPTRTLPFSILLDGDLRLDELRPSSGGLGRFPVLVEHGGHLYSKYPVTQSLLLTPLYVPAALYAQRAGIDFEIDRTYILLTASYRVWMGGDCFGPRYLTDVLPVLCALLVPVARDLRRPTLAPLFALALAWSLVVQLTGAFFYDGEWEQAALRRPSLRSSVRHSQIVMSWQGGLVSPRIGRLRDIGVPSRSE